MKKKKIFKFFLVILIILILILVSCFVISKCIKNKYKKILLENDSTNYELSETINGEDGTNCKVKNTIMQITDGENIFWINSKLKKKIVINTETKTAIVTENEDIQVVSLNHSYILEFFENSNMKFKYLGKKSGYALLEFTNKKTKMQTILYLNLETKLVEKIEEKDALDSRIIEYKIVLNSISNDEIVEPDLTNYYVVNQ